MNDGIKKHGKVLYITFNQTNLTISYFKQISQCTVIKAKILNCICAKFKYFHGQAIKTKNSTAKDLNTEKTISFDIKNKTKFIQSKP